MSIRASSSMLFAYEDKRFCEHHGVDLLALWPRRVPARHASGRIVSGGSTLTMQVARLLEPREHRSFDAKLRQMVRALELEHALSKDEILALYLTLAPYGGNLEGIRAASLAYFGKEPTRLIAGRSRAAGRAAAVARGAPAGPLPGRRRARRATACSTALARGRRRCRATRSRRAKQASGAARAAPMPVLAPHAADQAVAAAPDAAAFTG